MAGRSGIKTLVRRDLALVGALLLIGCGEGPTEEPANTVAPTRGALLTSWSGNMMDVNEIGSSNGRVQEMFLARSVPVLVDRGAIGPGNVLQTYHINLCDEQLFQGTVALKKSNLGIGCSSALVGNRLLLTSNHCLYDESLNQVSLDQFRVVFGYRKFGSTVNLTIPQDDIYTPLAIVARGSDFGAGDWALLLLDRGVSWRYRRLQIGGNPTVNDQVSMLGYPIHMPEKFSTPGAVFQVDSAMFRANISGMAGNSGSPIFLPNGVITGILSSGPEDMSWEEVLGCWFWYVNPNGSMVAKGAQTVKDALFTARRQASYRDGWQPPPPPDVPRSWDLAAPYSCAGACNGRSPDGCGCDAECSSRGDCCGDANNCAPYWNPGPTSCASSCGSFNGTCFCDALCPTFGDCCGDFFDTCGRW